MSATSIIYKRELGAYLRSPLGWIVTSILLLVDGILFQSQALSKSALSAAVLSYFFPLSAIVTMVAALAISIRLIADERQNNSMVLLNTSPVRDSQIILGKFFAALTFLAFFLLLTLYLPLLIKVNGKIAWAQIWVGYAGLLLLGAASLAVGLFASSLAKHQLIALVIGAAILAVMALLYPLSQRLDAPLATTVAQLDIFRMWLPQSITSFKDGVLAIKDVVYYVALTYFFLLLSMKTLEAKRWQ